MMIKVDETGRIVVIQSDPSEQDVIANLVNNYGYIYIPPIELPASVIVDADGEPVLEDGEVVYSSPGYTAPEVTHDRHMWDGEKVIERPVFPGEDAAIKADGADSYKVTGLPKPCTVFVDGEPYEIKDGKLEFSTSEPGTYVFRVEFPFVDKQVKVIAK